MSVVISNPNQICNSPLNLSKSKQLFSIPRETRFKELLRPSCSQAFYDLPTQKNQRKAGLGYGSKYDFTKDNQHIPGPNNYNIKRNFDPGLTKGPSMGLGRDQLAQAGTFFLKKGPGPGAYETQKSALSKVSYSIRAKTLDFSFLIILFKFTEGTYSTAVKAPGPGTYNVEPTLNPKGRYTLSRFANSGANIIAPASSKRFGYRPYETDAPGPGQYNPKNNMEKGGGYVLSRYQSSVGKTMPHCHRKEPVMTFHTSKNSNVYNICLAPGPGSYRLPSEFGFYEDKHKHE